MAHISIIIPAHNAEFTIERCIRSIYDNQCSEIEAIVVINNTTDKTKMICEDLKKKHPSLITISSSDCGVSAARNLGLDYATGDFIGFCDADDYYESNAIDRVIKLMDNSDIDFLITRFYRVEKINDKIVRKISSREMNNRTIDSKAARGAVLNDSSVMGSVWNKFYKSEVIKNQSFDEELTHCEDTYFNMKVLKNDSLKIELSNIISYNYVKNPDGATENTDKCYSNEGKLNYLFAFEKIQSEYEDDFKVRLEARYAMYVIAVMNYSKNLIKERKKYLKKCILSNWISVILLPKYGIKKNVKLLLKGTLIMFRLL